MLPILFSEGIIRQILQFPVIEKYAYCAFFRPFYFSLHYMTKDQNPPFHIYMFKLTYLLNYKRNWRNWNAKLFIEIEFNTSILFFLFGTRVSSLINANKNYFVFQHRSLFDSLYAIYSQDIKITVNFEACFE